MPNGRQRIDHLPRGRQRKRLIRGRRDSTVLERDREARKSSFLRDLTEDGLNLKR